jgi:hypothetical protein
MWDPAEHCVILTENLKNRKFQLYARIWQKSTIICHNSQFSGDFSIFGMRASSEISTNFFKNSDLFATELMWDPAEHCVILTENLKNRKFQLYAHIWQKSTIICYNSRFSGDFDFWYESFIWDHKKFFQSLRFVCNRTHVRSRRALCDFDRKSEKSKNINYVSIFVLN